MNYSMLQRLVLIGLSLALTQVTHTMQGPDDARYNRATAYYENLAEGEEPINQEFRKTISALKKDILKIDDIKYIRAKVHNNPEFITAEDSYGNSLLSIAAQKGHAEIAQFLIDNRARVNWPNKNGDTPLSLATSQAMINLLKSSGGIYKPDAKVYDRAISFSENLAEGKEPINQDFRRTIGALKKDYFTSADEEYVKGKINENPRFIIAEDTIGNSLLAIAAQKGRTGIAQFLIGQGARINWPNNAGATPLSLATNDDMITLLSSQGGTRGRRSPLVERVERFEQFSPPMPLKRIPSPQPIREVDSHWYDRNDPDNAVADLEIYATFQNALQAIQQDNLEFLKTEIEDSPALLTAEDSGGNSLLIHAAILGNVAIARYLIEQGARVNWPNKQGETPLAFAVKAGNRDMIALLQDNGGLVNAKITVMLVPARTYSEQLRQFAQNYFYTSRDIANLVNIKYADKLHMSIAYALVPMTYVDDATSQRRAADFLKKTSNMSTDLLSEYSEDPHFLDLSWDRTQPMGRFIAMSYNDASFKPYIEALYRAIENQWGMHKLYPREEPLHISIAETKDKKEWDPSTPLPEMNPSRSLRNLQLSAEGRIVQNVSVSYPVRGKNMSEMQTNYIKVREL